MGCLCAFRLFASCRSSEWYWEHQALLRTADAVKPLQRFYLVMVADKTIPMQGDVDLMTGGPPCQVRSLSHLISDCHANFFHKV